MDEGEKEAKNIFILGLCVLFAWMAVIIACASPQLFRDWMCRRCVENRKRNATIQAAEARLRVAGECVGVHLAANPSSILLHQALGRPIRIGEVIHEASKEEENSLS